MWYASGTFESGLNTLNNWPNVWHFVLLRNNNVDSYVIIELDFELFRIKLKRKDMQK